MAKLPKKKKWPRGLKRRLAQHERKQSRLSENKKIETAINAAKKKLGIV